jgi:hypothetical protein
MKKFLRKVNRGLVLGGVLIIGTTIYIIADLKNFEKEKPVVEQTITEYTQAVAKFNITPEKNREYNITLNKEDSQKLTADWQAIIDEYWIDKKASANDIFYYYDDKSYLEDSVISYIDNKQRGYVTDISINLSDCNVKKDGPNAAVVTCTSNVYYVGLENSAIFTPGGCNSYYTYFGNESPIDPKLMQTTFSENLTLYLEKKSDGWKITKSEVYDNYDVNVSKVQESDSESNSEN